MVRNNEVNCCMQKTYTSDLTDLGWEVIKTFFNPPTRRRKWSNRKLINAMFYVVKNGCTWRDLPGDFEIPWQTVYYYFNRWSSSGLLVSSSQSTQPHKSRELG